MVDFVFAILLEWFLAWPWLDMPWYLWPIPLLVLALGVLLRGALCLEIAPLPALDPHPRWATVTGHTTEVHGEEDEEHTHIHLRIDLPDGSFDSVLADLIAAEDLHRFAEGSRWSVRLFVDRPSRVFLSREHEDILCYGYHLDGVRIAGESVTSDQPTPGSHLLRKRFRS